MRTVLLAVARDALAQLTPFLRSLDAYAENLDLLRNVSFRFVNKGRHLGPAPGSPTAAIKKYHCRGSFSERRRKFHRRAVYILQFRPRKVVADFDLGHVSKLQFKRFKPFKPFQSSRTDFRSHITSFRFRTPSMTLVNNRKLLVIEQQLSDYKHAFSH